MHARTDRHVPLSRGILQAARAALEQAAAPEAPEVTPEPTTEPTSEPTPTPTVEPTPEVTPDVTPDVTPEPTPEATPEPTPTPPRYRDGEYRAKGWCEEIGNFRYEVLVTVKVEDGLIRAVSIQIGEDESDSPEDNDYFIDRAVNGTSRQKGVPAQIIEAQTSENIDGVSGATYTSDTIRRLVLEALRDAGTGGRR